MSPRGRLLLAYLLPLPVLVLSLAVGPTDGLGLSTLVSHLLGRPGSTGIAPATVRQILFEIRLPRVLLAFLVGGGLTVSGTALQVLARNPLVSPDILGLASGAAFGAALAMVVGWLPVQPTAFAGALLASGLTYFFAARSHRNSVVALVLSGVIVGGIFTAALAIVQMRADPYRLQSIVHWTMGNLHNASWTKLHSTGVCIGVGALWLVAMRWRLNVLALGDEETRAVGLDPVRQKALIIVPAALAASASVAVAGVIAMVGLVVPHMVRLVLGSDNTKCVPASIVVGGVFLVLVDDLARATTSFEVPIGVFTMLIGGPVFLFLLSRSNQRDFG
jgi:iron complex transport system permease protein